MRQVGPWTLPEARPTPGPGRELWTKLVTEPRRTGYIVGADLGQASDPSAIGVLERAIGEIGTFERTRYAPEGEEVSPRKKVIFNTVRFLHRPRLGTPYPAIVKSVGLIMANLPPAAEPPSLVVDATGVGRPVVDMFCGAGLSPSR